MRGILLTAMMQCPLFSVWRKPLLWGIFTSTRSWEGNSQTPLWSTLSQQSRNAILSSSLRITKHPTSLIFNWLLPVKELLLKHYEANHIFVGQLAMFVAASPHSKLSPPLNTQRRRAARRSTALFPGGGQSQVVSPRGLSWD